MGGFVVDPDDLRDGARELSRASRGLKDLRRHRRPADVAAAGHPGLARALSDVEHVADREVEDIADNTDDLATRLHAAGLLYRGTDDGTADALR